MNLRRFVRRPRAGTVAWLLVLGFLGWRTWPQLAQAVKRRLDEPHPGGAS